MAVLGMPGFGLPVRQTRRLFAGLLAAAALAGTFASTPAVAQTEPADDVQRLAGWLAGEWNNNEQVWQARVDAEEPKAASAAAHASAAKPAAAVEHMHTVVAPVAAPQLGSTVFFVQRSRGDDLAQATGARLFRLRAGSVPGSITLEVSSLPDEPKWLDAHRQPAGLAALAALVPASLAGTASCETTWRFVASEQAFQGEINPQRCHDATLAQPLRISASEWRMGSVRSRKARYFEGWVWIKHAGPQATADDKRASFTKRLQLHTEGQRAPVLFEDGSTSPYLLELAQLTYQNTRKPILKLALVDRATGKSVSYIWANTDATMIGMNLGWFQAGMTQKSERAAFGF